MSFRTGLVLALLVAAMISFTGLNDNSVIHFDDEGLYIQIASEMYDRNEYWMPYYMGQTNAYYKPPMFYWVAMLLFPTGFDRFLLARISVVGVGLLTIGFVYATGNRLYGRKQGLLAATLVATSIGFIIFGRVAMFDMLLTLSLLIPLYCFLRAWQEESGRWAGWFAFAGGVSCLVKGPVTVAILGVASLLVLLLFGRWKILLSRGFLFGMLGGLAAILSWPAAIAIQGDFPKWFRFFILQENMTKFNNPGAYPVGNFLANIFMWFAPWGLLLVNALAFFLLRGKWRRFEYAFPVCWAAAIIGVYLIPDTRINYYLLPVIIPAALLVSASLTEAPAWPPNRWIAGITALLLLLPAAIILNLVRGPAGESPVFVLSAVATGIAALCAGRFLLKRQPIYATVATALFIVFLLIGMQQVSPAKLPLAAKQMLAAPETKGSISRLKASIVVHYYWYYNHVLNTFLGDARSVAEAKETLTGVNMYVLGKPVAVTGKRTLLIMGETDLQFLAQKEPELVRRVVALYSWQQWKEQMTTEDILQVLRTGDMKSAYEPLHILQYR